MIYSIIEDLIRLAIYRLYFTGSFLQYQERCSIEPICHSFQVGFGITV